MNYWAEAMLLWSLQVLALVLILLLVSYAMRRGSAADRHRLWLVGLIAIAAMPAANLVIRVFPQELPPPEPVRYVTQPVESVITPVPQAAQLPAEPPRTAPQSAPLPRPFDPVPVLFVLWIGGMLIQLTRVACSYQHSRRLRAAAAIAPAQSLRVPAAHSSGIYVPMLAGIFRPVVLLPADIANWAEADELRAMVLHESAHFDRRDHLVNLFQAFVGAVLFFHPAVRYALRRMDVERELACDEHVLNAGIRPAIYAEVLLKVAERALVGQRHYQPAFHTSGKILERRITMISNYRGTNRKGSLMLRIARTISVIAVAMLLLPDRVAVSGAGVSVPVLVAGVPVSFGAEPPIVAQTPVATSTTAQAQPEQEVKDLSLVGKNILDLIAVLRSVQAAAPTIPGQAPGTGRVSGTIYDLTGALVPGVIVSLTNASGAAQGAVTNEAGAYTFPQVTNGQYTIEFRLPDFATSRRTILVRSQAVVEDAVLVMAPVTTSVQVSTAPPQAQPVTPRPSFPQRIGGDISAPNLIYQAKPAYPPGASAKGLQGAVHLIAVIGTDGTVVSVQMDPSQAANSLELAQAAITAVKQWRYRPALLNGMPVEFTASIEVNFTMN